MRSRLPPPLCERRGLEAQDFVAASKTGRRPAASSPNSSKTSTSSSENESPCFENVNATVACRRSARSYRETTERGEMREERMLCAASLAQLSAIS
jgi:hypothetical protein